MKIKMLQIFAVSLLMLAVAGSSGFAQTAKLPAVGEPAPVVSGLNQDGKEWKLADAAGKKTGSVLI